MTDPLAISIIIPTNNRAPILRIALERLLVQNLPDGSYEIVIVDDGSTDDTAAVVASFKSGLIVFQRQEQRRAAASARNIAIGLARAPILLFLDDDALVEPDFVAAHLEAHRQHPGSVVTGPIIEISDPAQASAATAWPGQGRHLNPFPSCNASVARDDILAVGGFDEEFTHYGWEDPEVYERLARRRLKRFFEPKAAIFHYKPPTVRRDFIARLRLEEQRGAMGALFYAKHPTLDVAFRTKALGLFRAADKILDRLCGLEGRARAALDRGVVPTSDFMRLLVALHVETSAVDRALDRLGPARRRALAEAASRRAGPPR